MPFSLFAARCIYVAKQPLKYRMDVIRRIYTLRVSGHTTLISAIATPELLSVI